MVHITILTKVIEALQAERYIVRLVHADNLDGRKNETYPTISEEYSSDNLLKSAKYLAYQNARGYNIYFRPIGYRYILLDDVSREQLKPLSEIKPCLLIETSPNNFQIWLKLSQEPQDREHAKQICRALADIYQADKGSAEPDHIGRLPSYTNRKPKYYNLYTGQYPFVKLHKSENRISPYFLPKGVCVLKENAQNRLLKEKKEKKENSRQDRSRQDFNNVCMWLRQKKSYNQLYELLKGSSEKAQSRVGDSAEKYLHSTIQNAIRITGISPKE